MQHKMHSLYYLETFAFLIQINLLWSLFNLLPIWPLDGGQATQILLSLYDRAGALAGAISFPCCVPAAWQSWPYRWALASLTPFFWAISP